MAETTENQTVDNHRRHGRRGDLQDRRAGRRLQLGERAVRRRPGPPGDHRARRGHRPPQGGRRPRPPGARHRPVDRQRPPARLVLPQQAAPAGRERAVREPPARGPLRRHRPHPRRRHHRSGRRAAPRRGPLPQRRSTSRRTVRRSRRPGCSRVTRASSSARRPVSRRPARLRSTASADRLISRSHDATFRHGRGPGPGQRSSDR